MKQTMQARGMFSKSKNYLYIITLILISYNVDSNTDIKSNILDHLSSLKNFSASFIQNDSESLSEGKFYVGEKRVRAEYKYPSKILIILDENKAMYYNYDLEEDEFFDPKNTSAWFFYDIFRNPYFFEDSKMISNKNEIILQKNGLDNEQRKYLINIYFENNPLILRKIEVLINEDLLQISIFNHNYNEDFEINFFKLINPSFFN